MGSSLGLAGIASCKLHHDREAHSGPADATILRGDGPLSPQRTAGPDSLWGKQQRMKVAVLVWIPSAYFITRNMASAFLCSGEAVTVFRTLGNFIM